VSTGTGAATEEGHDPRESFKTAAVNVVLGIIAVAGGYLFSMYLVAHSYSSATACFACLVVASVALYFTWYRNLPDAEQQT
jgi:hypothetical protein